MQTQLIEWLKGRIYDSDGGQFIGIDNDEPVSQMVLLTECRALGWIEFDSYSQRTEYTRYRLTTEGKSALGISAQETEKADKLGTFECLYHGYEIRHHDTRYAVYKGDELKCTKSDVYGAKDWIDGQPENFDRPAAQPRANNTIIVLNPTEEKLLRQIAFMPLAVSHHEDLEQAVKGLSEYGFIFLSNHNRNWFITKAGEQWLEEHPVGWSESAGDSYVTPTIPSSDVLDVTEWHTGNEDDGTPFVYGKTAKNHYSYDMQFSDETEGLAETLNAYATELRSLRNFHAQGYQRSP